MELFPDRGTNLCGAARELQEPFQVMEYDLQTKLGLYQIIFRFNPSNTPHFGGIWEREIQSVKSALVISIGHQPLSEDVLSTVLTDVEGISC